MIDQITTMTVQTALLAMFRKGWLDICTIDKCAKLMGIVKGGQAYELLSALHCVNFTDMPRDLAEAVPGMIGEVLQGFSIPTTPNVTNREGTSAATQAKTRTPLLAMFKK